MKGIELDHSTFGIAKQWQSDLLAEMVNKIQLQKLKELNTKLEKKLPPRQKEKIRKI